MKFWVKTNVALRWFFPNYLWKIKTSAKKVYLTFDDGPTPVVTPWVLAQLKQFEAKATFFCIGNNISKYPDLALQVQTAGHSIGNHTYHHCNGWKTSTTDYIENTTDCCETIRVNLDTTTQLFRPPYGKINLKQAKILRKKGYQIVMWDIISYDFDAATDPEQCVKNVIKNIRNGSIIVFHDSYKAEKNLRYALPKVLAFLHAKGYSFEKLNQSCS